MIAKQSIISHGLSIQWMNKEWQRILSRHKYDKHIVKSMWPKKKPKHYKQRLEY